jgi:hypothetical protein
MKKSEKKTWWQAMEDGELPDYSRDNLGLRKETPVDENDEAGGTHPEVLDGTTCPPAINRPSTAMFDDVQGDPNSTERPRDIFGPELKPSSAPARDVELLSEAELDREIAAAAKETKLGHIPPATAIAQVPIHSDGVQANSFVGVVPGTGVVFSNPNRQEGRIVHTPAAHEIAKKY